MPSLSQELVDSLVFLRMPEGTTFSDLANETEERQLRTLIMHEDLVRRFEETYKKYVERLPEAATWQIMTVKSVAEPDGCWCDIYQHDGSRKVFFRFSSGFDGDPALPHGPMTYVFAPFDVDPTFEIRDQERAAAKEFARSYYHFRIPEGATARELVLEANVRGLRLMDVNEDLATRYAEVTEIFRQELPVPYGTPVFTVFRERVGKKSFLDIYRWSPAYHRRDEKFVLFMSGRKGKARPPSDKGELCVFVKKEIKPTFLLRNK